MRLRLYFDLGHFGLIIVVAKDIVRLSETVRVNLLRALQLKAFVVFRFGFYGSTFYCVTLYHLNVR